MTREDIIKLVEQRQQIEPPPLLDALKEGELYWMLGSRDVLWIVEQAVAAEREACLKICRDVKDSAYAVNDRTDTELSHGTAVGALICERNIESRGTP